MLKDLSPWLATSDCFHLRLGNLRGNEDFTGDWISRRREHGPKVQLLTLLTIEKRSLSFGRRQHPTVPKEETPEPREREEKLKAKRQPLLIFVHSEH